MIKINDLSKSFGKKQVLKDINLTLEAGKIYGIVGRNGSGKTTLFRCLTGLEYYHGKIESELSPLKNHIGLLQTDPYFLDKITGREYLQLFCNARHKTGIDFDQQNAFDLPLDQYANQYSTGMKKKLALMAILLQDNQILILDEPYNGVDIQSNIVINEIIQRLKNKGKTLLIASHIFSTLNDCCDEIHLLEEGTFIQHVFPDDFGALEAEMKAFVLGDQVDRLNIYK